MRRLLLSLVPVLLLAPFAPAAEPLTVNLWPGTPPGDEAVKLPPESDTSKPGEGLVGGKPVIRLGNVSTPQLAVYRPESGKANGTAVVICPGGGHRILAYNHEGTEVAEWLNTLGVTAVVLKYRVPTREPNGVRYRAAVQDAQRAVRLVKSRASEWGIDANRVGLLGFSAGGETAGLAALLAADEHYMPADEADKVSAKPAFLALIYPAYLYDPATKSLKSHVKVSKDSPPAFLAHAYDDPVDCRSSLLLANELKAAGVKAELHLYATGGHGYGMRDTGHPVNSWPARLEDWLRVGGWLGKK